MAFRNEDEKNPYRAPIPLPGPHDADTALAAECGMVKEFREQIYTLGILWIILGVIAALFPELGVGVNLTLAGGLGDNQVVLIVVAGIVLFWLAVGVLTCLKQIAAVYVGLFLSYVSLLGHAISLDVCGVFIMISVILQAHRVIGWANQMRAAGVSLTAKPR